MRLIDANVFIYAAGREHEYRDSCARLLSETVRRRLDMNIDVETLQEILHFYRSRRDVETGVSMFHDILVDFARPLEVTTQTLRTAADILAANPSVQSRDAVHAAVVIENGLEGIISADRGFDEITSIKRFDPKEF